MTDQEKEQRYKEIIEGLTEDKIIALMKNLGADRYEDTPKAIIFPTICHNTDVEEASMKLYYYKDNKFFFCYSEDGGMSIFTFLKHYYETRNIAYDWYRDIFKVAENCSVLTPQEGFILPKYQSLKDKYATRQEITLPEYDEGVLDIFIKTYPPEWLNDGISREAMDKFNISYSISQNRIIIPHYDINDKLVGIRGRALDPEEVELLGKYMPVKIEGKWYSHELSFNLYGLNKNKDNIQRTGKAFVFEAEKSVLQCESFNIPNCAVAVCGSNFNKHQLNILLKNCFPQEIIICFDKEEKKGEDKYFMKLWNICKKYNQYCDFSFIYDTENLLNLKDSPSDKGEEIFKKLYNRRVKVN